MEKLRQIPNPPKDGDLEKVVLTQTSDELSSIAREKSGSFDQIEGSQEKLDMLCENIVDYFASYGVATSLEIDSGEVHLLGRGHHLPLGNVTAALFGTSAQLVLQESELYNQDDSKTKAGQHLPHVLTHELVHKIGARKNSLNNGSEIQGEGLNLEMGFQKGIIGESVPPAFVNFNEAVTEYVARETLRKKGKSFFTDFYQGQVQALEAILREMDKKDRKHKIFVDPKESFMNTLLTDYVNGEAESMLLIEDLYGKGSMMVFEQFVTQPPAEEEKMKRCIAQNQRIANFFSIEDSDERERLRNEIFAFEI